MPKRIDLLVCGAQKAGTSTLWKLLRDSPRIQMSRRKELHYFDDETVDWARPDYSRYHGNFDWSQNGQLRGEATPIYMFWESAPARIQRYRSDIRLLIGLRDPISRAYSHWKHESARAREVLSFSAAIREGRSRLSQGGPAGNEQRWFSYVERGFYGRQIRRLLSYFGREQIHIVVSERLFEAQQKTVDEITAFLGIPSYPVMEGVHANKAVSLPVASLSSEDVRYLSEIYHDERAELAAILGGWPKEWR